MNNDLDRGTNTQSGHVLDELSAYLDGVLGPGDLARVRAHIEACAECRATYLDLSATRTMLRSMPAIAPPRAFTLTEEMVAVEKRQRAGLWRLFLSPRNAPRFAMGSALALVLLVLVVVSDYTFLQPGRMSSLAAPAPAAQGPMTSNERSSDSSAASGAAPPAAAMATATTASVALSQAAPQVTMVTKAATENPTEITAGASAATSGQETAPAEQATSAAALGARLPAATAAAAPTTGGQAQANDQNYKLLPQPQKTGPPPTSGETGRTALLGVEIALGVLGALFAVGALLAYRRP